MADHGGAVSASQALGAFVAASRWGDLDPRLRHEAKRALLNYSGCALAAASDPAVATAATVMGTFSGPAQATVIGRSERLDPMCGAFVNAIAANLLDFDDTHWASGLHPTAPVAAAALAAAEWKGASGAEVLHASILGLEVCCRLAASVSPQHYARGMHITATCGVFGAAAAGSKLLGLDGAQTATALGIAASQSAGVMENLPTAAKNVAVGNAARGGLLAAVLAEAGYTAAPLAIEGPFGWARAVGDAPRMEEIVGGLGRRWEFEANCYKPYPCGYVFHAIIDAGLILREQLGLSGEDVASVTVAGGQLMLDRGLRPVVTDRDARVSIQHAAAVSLARGRAVADDFTGAAVADPILAALRRRVQAVLDPSLPIGAAVVVLETMDGRHATVRVDHARGSLGRPLTDEELAAKFLSNAGGASSLNDERCALVWSLDAAPDVRRLMSSMRG